MLCMGRCSSGVPCREPASHGCFPVHAVSGTASRIEPGESQHNRLLTAVLFIAILLIAITGAAVLRLAHLDNRPMHCDEGVQGIKFGQLLEDGHYVYNPREYHGPALNYLTLPVAWATSAETITKVTETQLRLVPAIAGIILVCLVWLVRDELGRTAAIAAALLAAVSPAMVFYSRYYIMEMLLVAATFAAMVAWWRLRRAGHKAATGGRAHTTATGGRAERGAAQPRPDSECGATNGRGFMKSVPWLILLGVSIGLMHASKETCILALFAMVVAALAVELPVIWRTGLRREQLVWLGLGAAIVLNVAAAVSAAFFSSFGSNPGGVADSYAAFLHYAGRASGEGSAGPQAQPWDYYFRALFYSDRPGGENFNELTIAVLALVGLAAAALGKPLKPEHRPAARFLAVYTVLLTAIYTAMPYKTPWSAMGFFHGMTLLAGVGAAALLHAAPWRWLKGVVIAVLAVSAVHLAWQSYQTNFVLEASPDNPYAHTPTHPSALRLCEKVRDVSTVHPDGLAMPVQVICPDDDFWPLPWYLRDMPRVGWHGKMSEAATFPPAPLIITRPELVAAVVKYAYLDQPPGHRHLIGPFPPEDGGDWLLRPGVPLEVMIRRELLDAYRSAAAAEKLPPETPR